VASVTDRPDADASRPAATTGSHAVGDTTDRSAPSARTVGPADPRATSEVMASAIANGQALVLKEIELAKLEMKRIATEKATAAGLAVAGAVLGLFILAFVGVTGAKALQLVVAEWLAWLIITLIYTLIAGILLAVAARFAGRPATPERTKETAEETVEWAKGQVQR
jgi:uncharacterized integral membrane protein